MTVTTASGLLPAGMAVYVQRGPNGVGLETRYSVGLQGFTSKRRTSEPNRERPAWEDVRSEGFDQKQSTQGFSIRTAVASADSNTSTASWRLSRAATV